MITLYDILWFSRLYDSSFCLRPVLGLFALESIGVLRLQTTSDGFVRRSFVMVGWNYDNKIVLNAKILQYCSRFIGNRRDFAVKLSRQWNKCCLKEHDSHISCRDQNLFTQCSYQNVCTACSGNGCPRKKMWTKAGIKFS